MNRQLLEPITDSGIRNANFFNGRLLTAEDLSAVLDASRAQRRQLGLGIGEGVIHGLEVELTNTSTVAQPVVRVSGGLAVNRRGQAVSLALQSVDVALAPAPSTFEPEAGLFAECTALGPADNLSNVGLYVFVAAPTSTYEGAVPVRHSLSNSKFDGCGKRYAVEGIKFRLERVNLSTLPGVSAATRTLLNTLTTQTDAAGLSKLRNVVAHLCFDSEETSGIRRDPFKAFEGDTTHVNYGALAALRLAPFKQLTDCDVPLALVYWSPQGVRFVDNWAVRRLARRVLDLDVLSVLRSYGYERLLQFQEQLAGLFDTLGGLSSVQLQNYFAYVPPVGFYHVTGPKSPRGFSPSNFLKQFTSGQPSDISAERFGAVLRESFAAPAAALSSAPVFTVYRVRDNVAAVAASQPSSQLYHAFVSRAMNGPLAHDGAALALLDAWKVYRGLIKKRVFLPRATDAVLVAAQLGITAVVRDVLDVSNRRYVLAAGTRLDIEGALAAYQEMYDVQQELAVYFQSPIPGIQDTQEREQFGAELQKLLNSTVGGGKPGLLPAIQMKDLLLTIHAQNVINAFVGGWTGEGVAVGPFGATWQSSPQGQDLIPGHPTPFEHHFLVSNGTDKGLKFKLEAETAAAHGDWTGSTTIERAGFGEVDSIELASGASGTVILKVKAPADAQAPDEAQLTLRTTAPPPTSTTDTAGITLHVQSSTGGQGAAKIEFVGPVSQPTGDPDNAVPGQVFTYGYNLRYTAPAGVAAPAAFRVVVNLTSSTQQEWGVSILDNTPSATQQPSPGVFQRQLNLTPSVTTPVQIFVTVPTVRDTSLDKTAELVITAESVSLNPQIETDPPQELSFRLRPPIIL